MKYFAYGSNLSLSRIRNRVPSAISLGCHTLAKHDLRFHKVGQDGSGKCDAYFTGSADDVMYGVLFEMDTEQKRTLDRVEGLGFGYDEKKVEVVAPNGAVVRASTYIATHIDENLKPYSWYVNHVIVGAREASLPDSYIEKKISTIEAMEDANQKRDAEERAIHRILD